MAPTNSSKTDENTLYGLFSRLTIQSNTASGAETSKKASTGGPNDTADKKAIHDSSPHVRPISPVQYVNRNPVIDGNRQAPDPFGPRYTSSGPQYWVDGEGHVDC
ncbi:unnamed protein product [Zymoseptoria tritici ST99CH_1E4]|uniref:Uncharacterized protein n=1 Tax=Zymoseptoria tritici ST99CH_1E4 TaxID=1276532 RepID=A0A2H1GUI0_ZYMTR|nr:unnamed protein product [Zymoseptoria tritici ST99CH_1E4]